jgi:hypothetical protein
MPRSRRDLKLHTRAEGPLYGTQANIYINRGADASPPPSSTGGTGKVGFESARRALEDSRATIAMREKEGGMLWPKKTTSIVPTRTKTFIFRDLFCLWMLRKCT